MGSYVIEKLVASNLAGFPGFCDRNYVVQYILDLGMIWASIEVMVRLENHYPYLAMQKFSSNVVEKCLKLATDENRGRIVRELMGSPRLGQMLQDPYANYVVQSALTVAKASILWNFPDWSVSVSSIKHVIARLE